MSNAPNRTVEAVPMSCGVVKVTAVVWATPLVPLASTWLAVPVIDGTPPPPIVNVFQVDPLSVDHCNVVPLNRNTDRLLIRYKPDDVSISPAAVNLPAVE